MQSNIGIFITVIKKIKEKPVRW